MAGWLKTTIGELCDRKAVHIQTGPFGSQLHVSDYVPVGIPVIPTEAIAPRRLKTETLPQVSPQTASRLARHRLRVGDILFARRGAQATGLSAIVVPEQDGWLCGTGVILLRIQSPEIDPTFMSFLLSSKVSVQWFKSHAVGAVMPNLNEEVIRKFPLTLPARKTQEVIGSILKCFDDKMELNRKMNETLEAMAWSIFKSWFVDFDPVRAKAEGRQPFGIDAKTAASFPGSFQDSPLGKIPKGWKVLKLSEVCELAYGRALKADDRQAGSVPVYGSNGRVGWHDEPLVKGPGIVVGRKGNPGFVTWVPHDFFPIDTTFFVISHLRCGGMRYLFHELGSLDLPSLGADSAVPGLNRNIAYMTDVLVPSPEIIEAFEHFVEPIWRHEMANVQESGTIVAIRDALLPKLISGEIRLEDAEESVESLR